MNRRVYCSFVREVAHRGGSIVRINHAFSRDFCYEAAVEVPDDGALEVGALAAQHRHPDGANGAHRHPGGQIQFDSARSSTLVISARIPAGSSSWIACPPWSTT